MAICPHPRLSLKNYGDSSPISVAIKDIEENLSPEIHWHYYYEIELVLEGSCIHQLNGSEYELKKGSAFFITPTDLHSIFSAENLKIINISFSEDILTDNRLLMLSTLKGSKHTKLNDNALTKLYDLALMIKSENDRTDGGCAKELCECFFTIFFRNFDDIPLTENDTLSSMRKAIIYLNTHFRESPTLKQVAEQAGFNPHYFSEMFKRTTGQNYSERLNHLKVKFAKSLLKNDFSVTDACYLSGFGSPTNFLTVFKKHTGFSPKDYKKKK